MPVRREKKMLCYTLRPHLSNDDPSFYGHFLRTVGAFVLDNMLPSLGNIRDLGIYLVRDIAVL
jgi:hypothetical protein